MTVEKYCAACHKVTNWTTKRRWVYPTGSKIGRAQTVHECEECARKLVGR